MRGNAAKYFFHGDIFIAPDRIIASADVDSTAGAEAGIHAFDRDSGRELWMHPAGRGVLGAGGWESPAAVGRRVFGGSTDGSLYAFHSDTGRVEWQQKLGAPISTSIRGADSGVYAGTSDGTIHRLAPGTGEKLSSLKLDPALEPSAAPLHLGRAVFVLLADQEANYRALVSLDPALTRVNWRRAAPDRWSTSRVFATATTVVLGTPSGEVTAYCIPDGSPAWSYKLSAAPIRAVGGTDDTLFVGTPQGTLYAIRPPRSCM